MLSLFAAGGGRLMQQQVYVSHAPHDALWFWQASCLLGPTWIYGCIYEVLQAVLGSC